MKNLNVIFLKDYDEGSTDGVIVTSGTTKEEIQKVVNKVKEEKAFYTDRDIEMALPKDCKLYWKNNNVVYY